MSSRMRSSPFRAEWLRLHFCGHRVAESVKAYTSCCTCELQLALMYIADAYDYQVQATHWP